MECYGNAIGVEGFSGSLANVVEQIALHHNVVPVLIDHAQSSHWLALGWCSGPFSVEFATRCCDTVRCRNCTESHRRVCSLPSTKTCNVRCQCDCSTCTDQGLGRFKWRF